MKDGARHNHVLSHNDSTCHGEIDAIRKAVRLMTMKRSDFRDVEFEHVIMDEAARAGLLEQHDREMYLGVFNEYNQKNDKVNY